MKKIIAANNKKNHKNPVIAPNLHQLLMLRGSIDKISDALLSNGYCVLDCVEIIEKLIDMERRVDAALLLRRFKHAFSLAEDSQEYRLAENLFCYPTPNEQKHLRRSRYSRVFQREAYTATKVF